MSASDFSPEELSTIHVYDTFAHVWAQNTPMQDHSHAELAELKKLLPSGFIFELGSAEGNHANEIIKKGYSYLGSDVSKSLIEVARSRYPDIPFQYENPYALSLPDNTFDGIWSLATLMHIPKQRIKHCLVELNRVLKPGGYGCISVVEGVGEGEKIHRRGGIELKRFYAFYQSDEFSKVLQNANFKTVKIEKKQIEDTDWLTFFVQSIK